MNHATTPLTPPAGDEATRPLGAWPVLAYGFGGFVLTPILVYAIGWLLYGERGSWSEGQGEGFVAFVLAVYAIPFGAVFGLLTGLARRLARTSAERRTIGLVAAGVYVTGLVVAVFIAMTQYA